jgi:class 3 adenylate cyclase
MAGEMVKENSRRIHAASGAAGGNKPSVPGPGIRRRQARPRRLLQAQRVVIAGYLAVSSSRLYFLRCVRLWVGCGMTERRLAAILAADISGYSALMGADEETTVRDLKSHQAVLLPLVAVNGGRIIDTAGDGILAEFSSVLNAVTCAVVMQDVMEERNGGMPPSRRMQFRIGINQGDVLSDGIKLYGDGVNLAVRLEAMAPPGSICISGKVYDEVRGRLGVGFDDMGEQGLKNTPHLVRVYRVDRQRTSDPTQGSASAAILARQVASRRLQVQVARHGLQREQVAVLTGLSLAVIDMALKGEASSEVLAHIEQGLANVDRLGTPKESTIALRPSAPRTLLAMTNTAPLEIGGYTRGAVDHYIGRYLTIRPSFTGNGTIYSYCTEISWSDTDACLVFAETKRPDTQYQHTGRVYIPPSSGFVYLVSLTKGAMRSILVSQLGQTSEMRGIITTLANDTGVLFIPAAAPIIYLRRNDIDELSFGHLTPDDASFDGYRRLLRDTVQQSFVRWVEAV